MAPRGSDDESEGSGEEIRPYGDNGADNDSSEEEEEDEEALKRVKEGFIVSSDEDEEAVSGETKEEKRRRRKEKRRRKRKRDSPGLDEEDLELINEASGIPTDRAATKRSRVDADGDELMGNDIFDDDDAQPSGSRAGGVTDMFNDADDSRKRNDQRDDDEDLDDFIEDDDDDEDDDDAAREAKKQEKRKQAQKRQVFIGADREARQDLEDVFGNGEDYEEFLEEERTEGSKKAKKALPKLEDVFEPAEIADRMLLPQDAQIRGADIPERHQMSTSTLSRSPILYEEKAYPNFDSATAWVAPRLSERTHHMFIEPNPDLLDAFPEQTRPDLKQEYENAVKFALTSLFEGHNEVPHIWYHLRDNLIEHSDDRKKYVTFVNLDELWECYDLGLKYRAISERRSHLQETYNKLKDIEAEIVQDGQVVKKKFQPNTYFEDNVLAVPSGTAEGSVEGTNEALAWLEFRYPEYMRIVKKDTDNMATQKRPGEGATAKRVIREGAVVNFMEQIGIEPSQVAVNLLNDKRDRLSQDHDESPIELAERYPDQAQGLLEGSEILAAAKELLIAEFGKDPVLLDVTRKRFQRDGQITVRPTEKGKTKIDELHIFYHFKYTREKPISEFSKSPIFCQMLAAEAEGLVDIVLTIPESSGIEFENALCDAYQSPEGNHEGPWYKLRQSISSTALQQRLIPTAKTWIKEDLRQRSEGMIAKQCQIELQTRVDVKPFATPSMEAGASPSVVALSFGRGGQDAIQAVFLNTDGRLVAQAQYDNMVDKGPKEEFIAALKKHTPDVIVIGGFSAETARLRSDVEILLKDMATSWNGSQDRYEDEPRDNNGASKEIPLIYVQDDVARIYMNSVRATEENPEFPPNARYALGLARYAQDPLNEYCALGGDVVAVSFIPRYQPYVPQELLLYHLERALVNVVNSIGVSINTVLKDTYVAKLLPFVAGLGPRKADQLIRIYHTKGDGPINRVLLLDDTDAIGTKPIVNALGFLFFTNPTDLEESELEPAPGEDFNTRPDPLDGTRIHPYDYEIARDLCENILDVDPDDADSRNPSKTVLRFMTQENPAEVLDMYDLNEFVKQIRQREGSPYKGYTVSLIEAELALPFHDRRPAFRLPTEWQILTMLTGETVDTIGVGKIVTAFVSGVKRDRAFVRLESKVAGEIPLEYLTDQGAQSIDQHLTKGQIVRGVVADVRPAELWVQISIRQQDVASAQSNQLLQGKDPFWDIDAEAGDMQKAERKRRKDEANLPRILTHPQWKVMDRRAAEAYLRDMNRGDAVIRPSSQGQDHLTVTWKVDDGIYQHIDILELNKPDPLRIGQILRINNESSYSDLDEVLVLHVQAIAAQVDKLTQHEKYKPEKELEQYLSEYVLAHPGSSAYGFSLDRKRAGWAKLCFLDRPIKDGGVIQAWPVRILPGAFRLFDAEVPGVQELCNAFKAQYRAKMEDQKLEPYGRTPRPGPAAFGRTPSAFGRTPAGRSPYVHAPNAASTPNPYPSRGPSAATHNPYAAQGVAGYGGSMATPNPYAVSATPNPYAIGGATPSQQAMQSFPPSFPPAYGNSFPPPGVPQNMPYSAMPYGAMPPPGVPQNMPYGAPPTGMPPPPPPPPPGFIPPPPQAAPRPSSGMNPARAAMIAAEENQGQGGYGGYSGH